MGILHTAFEVELPGRHVADARNLVSVRRDRRLGRGLYLRRRGDGFVARVLEWSDQSTTPTFRGEIVSMDGGCRLVGRLMWIQQIAWTVTPSVLGLGLTFIAWTAATTWNALAGVAILACAVFLLAVGAMAAMAWRPLRWDEETKLREALKDALALRR